MSKFESDLDAVLGKIDEALEDAPETRLLRNPSQLARDLGATYLRRGGVWGVSEDADPYDQPIVSPPPENIE